MIRYEQGGQEKTIKDKMEVIFISGTLYDDRDLRLNSKLSSN